MRFPEQRFFMVVFLIVIFFLHCFSGDLLQTRELEASSQSEKLILFVTSLEKLMCFPCLNPFLDFYKLLPSPFREDRVWGVVVYENSKINEERLLYEKIVQKKLRGFLIANDINCPVVLDSFHSFKELFEEGTTILVFDKSRKVVEKYVFPLSKKQIEEILSLSEE